MGWGPEGGWGGGEATGELAFDGSGVKNGEMVVGCWERKPLLSEADAHRQACVRVFNLQPHTLGSGLERAGH